jgi:hypothetical protein
MLITFLNLFYFCSSLPVFVNFSFSTIATRILFMFNLNFTVILLFIILIIDFLTPRFLHQFIPMHNNIIINLHFLLTVILIFLHNSINLITLNLNLLRLNSLYFTIFIFHLILQTIN